MPLDGGGVGDNDNDGVSGGDGGGVDDDGGGGGDGGGVDENDVGAGLSDTREDDLRKIK